MAVFLQGAFAMTAGDVAQPEDWWLVGRGGSGGVGQGLGKELFLTLLQSGLTSTDPNGPGCGITRDELCP